MVTMYRHKVKKKIRQRRIAYLLGLLGIYRLAAVHAFVRLLFSTYATAPVGTAIFAEFLQK